TTMVIVSIVPFAPRRILVWVAAFSALSVANCFANSLLFSAKRTPYDHQMARIQPVLSTPVPPRRGDLSLLLVNHWIGELRAIPYRYSMNGRRRVNWRTSQPEIARGRLSRFINECERTARGTCAWL